MAHVRSICRHIADAVPMLIMCNRLNLTIFFSLSVSLACEPLCTGVMSSLFLLFLNVSLSASALTTLAFCLFFFLFWIFVRFILFCILSRMQAHTKINCANTKEKITERKQREQQRLHQQRQQKEKQQYAMCVNCIAMLILFVICTRDFIWDMIGL